MICTETMEEIRIELKTIRDFVKDNREWGYSLLLLEFPGIDELLGRAEVDELLDEYFGVPETVQKAKDAFAEKVEFWTSFGYEEDWEREKLNSDYREMEKTIGKPRARKIYSECYESRLMLQSA